MQSRYQLPVAVYAILQMCALLRSLELSVRSLHSAIMHTFGCVLVYKVLELFVVNTLLSEISLFQKELTHVKLLCIKSI